MDGSGWERMGVDGSGWEWMGEGGMICCGLLHTHLILWIVMPRDRFVCPLGGQRLPPGEYPIVLLPVYGSCCQHAELR